MKLKKAIANFGLLSLVLFLGTSSIFGYHVDKENACSVVSDMENGPRKVWFHLRDLTNLQYTESLLGFLEGATEGWDNLYDASPSSNGFHLVSLVGEKRAVIQGLPPFTGNEVVMWETKTILPSSYSFVKDRDVDFEEDIWLRDMMTDEVVQLSVQDMTFVEPLPNGVRFFEMYFKDPNLSSGANRYDIINEQLFHQTRNGIRVNQTGKVTVVNINGQIVQEYELNAGQFLRVFPSLAPHLVKFENVNIETVKKFIK